MRRTIATAFAALAVSATWTSVAAADRQPYPHDFNHNMGYCAPYLAQLTTPQGERVRPFINHLLQDLTQSGTFEGQRNVGDLYGDRARSETDLACVAR
jgi:hypothetical protein